MNKLYKKLLNISGVDGLSDSESDSSESVSSSKSSSSLYDSESSSDEDQASVGIVIKDLDEFLDQNEGLIKRALWIKAKCRKREHKRKLKNKMTRGQKRKHWDRSHSSNKRQQGKMGDKVIAVNSPSDETIYRRVIDRTRVLYPLSLSRLLGVGRPLQAGCARLKFDRHAI